MKTKKCSKCNIEKTEADFFKSGTRPSGEPRYRPDCKECAKKDTAEWRVKNRSEYNNYAAAWRAKNPGKQHANDIKRHYGLSLEQYNELLARQACQCRICGKQHDPSVKRGRLYVDHCHKSGKVRALLCGGCNSMLGHANDEAAILLKAIDYLRAFAL
jgi:hypothetical protein